jgi:hypothetical protein
MKQNKQKTVSKKEFKQMIKEELVKFRAYCIANHEAAQLKKLIQWNKKYDKTIKLLESNGIEYTNIVFAKMELLRFFGLKEKDVSKITG